MFGCVRTVQNPAMSNDLEIIGILIGILIFLRAAALDKRR
jgi:hypothetical protein